MAELLGDGEIGWTKRGASEKMMDPEDINRAATRPLPFRGISTSLKSAAESDSRTSGSGVRSSLRDPVEVEAVEGLGEERGGRVSTMGGARGEGEDGGLAHE